MLTDVADTFDVVFSGSDSRTLIPYIDQVPGPVINHFVPVTSSLDVDIYVVFYILVIFLVIFQKNKLSPFLSNLKDPW